MRVTAIITKASDFGILKSILNVGQAKVQITTINMSPTSAARGIIAINELANIISNIRNIAAEAPEILPRPPLDILIID